MLGLLAIDMLGISCMPPRKDCYHISDRIRYQYEARYKKANREELEKGLSLKTESHTLIYMKQRANMR